MKWKKLTIDTTTEATDMISYTLGEMGIEGIEVEDHVPLTEEDRKTMYVDLLPDERESMERRFELVEQTLEKRIRFEGGRLR